MHHNTMALNWLSLYSVFLHFLPGKQYKKESYWLLSDSLLTEYSAQDGLYVIQWSKDLFGSLLQVKPFHDRSSRFLGKNGN